MARKLFAAIACVLIISLVAACSFSPIKIKPIQIGRSGGSDATLGINYLCENCETVREGQSPLTVELWLSGINASPEKPVLWTIQGLNSGFLDTPFSKSTERFVYTFKLVDTYSISAEYEGREIASVEFRVTANPMDITFMSQPVPSQPKQWCSARIRLLEDPSKTKNVPYWIEVYVHHQGLETIVVNDFPPYHVAFPEPYWWVRNPPVSADPYLFPTRDDPQVLKLRYEEPLGNQPWKVEVRCVDEDLGIDYIVIEQNL